jgi:hypothetical protein
MDFLLRLLDFFKTRVVQERVHKERRLATLIQKEQIWKACPPKRCVHQKYVQSQTHIYPIQKVSRPLSEMGTLSHRIKDIHQVAMISEYLEGLFCNQEVT